MTGGGDGYCMLKIPRTPDEPSTGFAVRSGKLVVPSPDLTRPEIASLHERARDVRFAIRDLERQVMALEATLRPSGASKA